MDPLELANRIAQYADDKKAHEVVILDMSELLYVTDYFVICSGANDRQVKGISDNIRKELRDLGIKPLWSDGDNEGIWVVLDYGNIVVHVFRDEERDIYQLERLWKDAPRAEWAPSEAAEA